MARHQLGETTEPVVDRRLVQGCKEGVQVGARRMMRRRKARKRGKIEIRKRRKKRKRKK